MRPILIVELPCKVGEVVTIGSDNAPSIYGSLFQLLFVRPRSSANFLHGHDVQTEISPYSGNVDRQVFVNQKEHVR